MNPHHVYQQHRTLGWARVDMLLALFEEAIAHLEKAAAAPSGESDPQRSHSLDRARLLVAGLAAGVDVGQGDLPRQILLLYEFILHSLETREPGALAAALDVLRTLRESFQSIRAEAVRLERTGAIPPLDREFTGQQSA